ncbi:hypothetical protein MUK72_16225 (plasmid) [Halococcus dombrowskii]|uniref:Uncharacterized protein n=1 Tax=Halococcus dombrowskii TaxID=179637 RepID=A0AAV3SDP2_HALDO|nr:hypothetical protein [Halococcus dombrowskii]UOO96901.1 hypothetical protein MUK72_16225 [Halococcus dombrowskii]
MEVLLVELLGQGPAEAVEIGNVEIAFLAERCELVVIGDRMKLFAETEATLVPGRFGGVWRWLARSVIRTSYQSVRDGTQTPSSTVKSGL